MTKISQSPDALLGQTDKQDLRIKQLIELLNSSSITNTDPVDLECQRELEDGLIEIINDRFNGVSQDEYSDATAIDKILKQILSPSEYLKNELHLLIYELISSSAKSLSDEAANPVSFGRLELD